MAIWDDPVLNSAFAEPKEHYELDDKGVPTGTVVKRRRPSEHLVPIPPPRKVKKAKGGEQAELFEGEPVSVRTSNLLINELRAELDRWRRLDPVDPKAKLTHTTRRLLEHWRRGLGEQPLFFCQIEAIETLIWLTEVAPDSWRERIAAANAEANPDLFRLCCKMATGAGKTTVMALVIAWQAVNHARMGASTRFSNRFLLVAPGITIKDRLRVLLPSDPDNYYEKRNLVPRDMLDDLRKARVVITNYHAFKRKERLQAPKLTRQILGGREGEASFAETEGQMLARVCPELLAGKGGVVVINDEAHHCYRAKAETQETKLASEEREEAKRNAEAARLWISGIEALNRKVGVKTVYDLSATPFFLRGSGWKEGTLFPWVVSDFSLTDAIECGIVKVPRVPIADDRVDGGMPLLRNVYHHVKNDLPKSGRAKQGADRLKPGALPAKLENALQALYGHYAKTFDLWREAGIAVPPVFIVVCNNTSTSKLVHDWIAGHELEVDGHKRLVPGKLPLFSNVEHDRWLARPRTLLIDSEELESGEALSPEFRQAAAGEIEAFKRELRLRFGAASDEIDDATVLREVMNTVGKPGKLGEQVRCVVSVAMLTEGWDATTVKHILGVRAFGTQLLCEQVVGRGLRRVSYEPGKDGLLEPEYAEILGIPFAFANTGTDRPPQKPKPITWVRAAPERLVQRPWLEIRFPRIQGYRVALPNDRLKHRFVDSSTYKIDPDDVAGRTTARGIVGESVELTLDDIRQRRMKEVAFYVAGHALRSKFLDEDGHVLQHLFPQVLRITQEWIDGYFVCKSGLPKQLLLWRDFADEAASRIYNACVRTLDGTPRLLAVPDPYNPNGSTRHIGFATRKSTVIATSPERCHVDHLVWDSEWEQHFALLLEETPEVLAYVKNHGLGFEVPYTLHGQERKYRPDYIVKLEVGQPVPLHLIAEIKGFMGEDVHAKNDAMFSHWLPAVNNHGGFGRWAFLVVKDIYDAKRQLDDFIAGQRSPRAA